MASPRLVLASLLLCTVALAAANAVKARTEPLPASYDLRNLDGHSYIGPVREQGNAGTCYAFAAIAVAESTYNRATGRYDDAVADFSESFISWSLDPKYEGIMGTDADNRILVVNPAAGEVLQLAPPACLRCGDDETVALHLRRNRCRDLRR